MTPTPGTQFYLSPFWVEIASYSPQSKIVRFRKLSRTPTPIQRMGRLAFLKRARAG